MMQREERIHQLMQVEQGMIDGKIWLLWRSILR